MSFFSRNRSSGNSLPLITRTGRGAPGARHGRDGHARDIAAESLEPRRLLSVGPDASGYVADAAPVQDIDLVPGGPGVASLLGDSFDSLAPVDLGGNTFRFYGKTYTGDAQILVSTHGFLALGGSY